MPETPVGQPIFGNARHFFVGSDDVPAETKITGLTTLTGRLRLDGRTRHRRNFGRDQIVPAMSFGRAPCETGTCDRRHYIDYRARGAKREMAEFIAVRACALFTAAAF